MIGLSPVLPELLFDNVLDKLSCSGRLALEQADEPFNREPCVSYDGSESPLGEFPVLRDRDPSVRLSPLPQDDVGTSLVVDVEPCL